ncbi:MAG: FAD-binding protein [Deltaproteobacteria bacterium]|nr:FAD-binding protein [Candidatus Anaeroferrophillus wilburensis]MBN2889783.1 FAD-binding protein [Deltaproteobacteria bacterium]
MTLKQQLITSGLTDGQILDSPEALLCYGYDATRQCGQPQLAVFPETTAQVAAVMKIADRESIPVFPRGAGSGMSGGSVPVSKGMVLSLTSMKNIIEIDLDNLMAVVEPGVITLELQEAVMRHGLMYPPDPASLAFSTIGGNVAENAGGPRAVKYGVTGNYVRGLEVVLPNGDIINTGNKCVKSVSGYDLTHLFVGSEGTLGVITRILLQLVPAPAATETLLLAFAEMETAAQTITEMVRNRIIPSTTEFLDHHSIAAIRDALPFSLPTEARTLLLVEVDGDPDTVSREAAAIRQLVASRCVLVLTATDKADRELLWQARRSLSPAIAKIAPHKINEDIAVPRSAIPAVLNRIEAISRATALPIVCFGHAGDGNIHVNVMLDKNNPHQTAHGEQAVREIFAATIELGGTLSGEHGIGNTKSAFFPLEWSPETIAVMQRVKKAFDPHNILNPGKIFPPANS